MLFYILDVIQDRYFHSFSDTTDVMLQGKDRYPYPVGFHAVRCYNGETYQMEIHEGTRGPLFVVRNCIRQLELDLLIRIKFNLSYLCISSILFTFEYLLSLWLTCGFIAWNRFLLEIKWHAPVIHQPLLGKMLWKSWIHIQGRQIKDYWMPIPMGQRCFFKQISFLTR